MKYMINEILSAGNGADDLETRVLSANDARLMFLYLFFKDAGRLDEIGDKILASGDLKYIWYLLRSFHIKEYEKYLLPILDNSDDPGYLFNVLYDVDYLDEASRLRIIDKIIETNSDRYILKSIYYYFVVLDLFDEELYLKMNDILFGRFQVEIDKTNYKVKLSELFYMDDSNEDPSGFSTHCFSGRNEHTPNLIVCHINHTYSSAIQHFYDENGATSSHFVIRRDGHVKQVVSLDDSAWANGTTLDEKHDNYYKFAHSKIIKSTADNANYFTFSIEHESFDGTLTREQFDSTIKVMRKIIAYLKERYNYDFPIDREHIIGHSDVNPILRRKCPGEKFPFDEIIQALRRG